MDDGGGPQGIGRDSSSSSSNAAWQQIQQGANEGRQIDSRADWLVPMETEEASDGAGRTCSKWEAVRNEGPKGRPRLEGRRRDAFIIFASFFCFIFFYLGELHVPLWLGRKSSDKQLGGATCVQFFRRPYEVEWQYVLTAR